MISDVLSDAVHYINDYLNNPTFKEVYKDAARQEIVSLRDAMDKLRQKLDALPTKKEDE